MLLATLSTAAPGAPLRGRGEQAVGGAIVSPEAITSHSYNQNKLFNFPSLSFSQSLYHVSLLLPVTPAPSSVLSQNKK